MAGPPESPPGPVSHQIIEAVNRLFHPSSSPRDEELARHEYNDIVARTATPILMPALSSLIRPGRLGDSMRDVVMRTLTELPLRPDGVRASLEFLLAAHPDNKRTQPQKGGASITPKAVSLATKLLCRVPSQLTPEAWFDGIASQMYQLLDGEAGHDLSRIAVQIIDLGILRAGRYGSPGAPGWNALVLPLLECVNPSLRSEAVRSNAAVVELRFGQVIVPAQSLETALIRLETLMLPISNLGACYRVLHRIILPLWAMCSWRNTFPGWAEPRSVRAARGLVQKYLGLFGELENSGPLIENLLYKGPVIPADHSWVIHQNADGELEIVHCPPGASQANRELDLSEIPHKVTVFVDILTAVYTDEQAARLFLHLLQRWVERRRTEADVQVRITLTGQEAQSPLLGELIETTLLMDLVERAPEKLVTQDENKVVPIICQLLLVDDPSASAGEASAVALSLLNLFITSGSFQKSGLGQRDLELIQRALEKISGQDRPELSPMARNLALLLQSQGASGVGGNKTPNASLREIEDRKTYSLAMTYISGDGENPPPVVAEGLSLLSTLILAQSPILDVMAVTVLMSSLLKEDDFVNAKVIKVFTQLANKHPKSTVQELLDNYLDAQEKASTDTRLRFGEAMMQAIERLGETFSDDIAKQTCETLLSIAGRRGHRPKTAVKQAKEEKVRKTKQEKGMGSTEEEEEVSDGEAMTESEKANREILAQMIQGWNSKRGSEDVRMRTSALSIMGAALESNIGGIERTVVSNVVDLSAHVLTMEKGLEYGILRRAAVMTILSYVKAIDEARESRQGLGLALTETRRLDLQRILAYVAETDNDGLVQQHARDVLERLETGCSRELLMPEHEPPTAGLSERLAGLRVNQRRPRIEEVD